ncbi:MAG: polymerase, sigma-24 subunit, subfamily [Verrucomicrobiales bacterium]|nr:polymerase, sigma-24 subunit, subfamily [Verrucomicrobiales bacterium]
MDSESQNDAQFLELIGQNRPKLLKICRVYTWNTGEQDDLYQEILFQLWRALPSFKANSHANTWLYRVALNTAITFVRKNKTSRMRVVPCDTEELQQIPAHPTHDPDKTEQIRELLRAISQLNDLEKAAITLFLEDLGYEEIASVMGISEGNVGVILHRAKKKLSTLMKELA